MLTLPAYKYDFVYKLEIPHIILAKSNQNWSYLNVQQMNFFFKKFARFSLYTGFTVLLNPIKIFTIKLIQ
jgi:hypothetical protein